VKATDKLAVLVLKAELMK